MGTCACGFFGEPVTPQEGWEMRAPGVFYRATHVMVFVIVILVLGFGAYAAVLTLSSPMGSSSVIQMVDGLRAQP